MADLRKKTLGSQNFDKSSQGMPIPGVAIEDEGDAFPTKRGTFESSRGEVVENS